MDLMDLKALQDHLQCGEGLTAAVLHDIHCCDGKRLQEFIGAPVKETSSLFKSLLKQLFDRLQQIYTRIRDFALSINWSRIVVLDEPPEFFEPLWEWLQKFLKEKTPKILQEMVCNMVNIINPFIEWLKSMITETGGIIRSSLDKLVAEIKRCVVLAGDLGSNVFDLAKQLAEYIFDIMIQNSIHLTGAFIWGIQAAQSLVSRSFRMTYWKKDAKPGDPHSGLSKTALATRELLFYIGHIFSMSTALTQRRFVAGAKETWSNMGNHLQELLQKVLTFVKEEFASSFGNEYANTDFGKPVFTLLKKKINIQRDNDLPMIEHALKQLGMWLESNESLQQIFPLMIATIFSPIFLEQWNVFTSRYAIFIHPDTFDQMPLEDRFELTKQVYKETGINDIPTEMILEVAEEEVRETTIPSTGTTFQRKNARKARLRREHQARVNSARALAEYGAHQDGKHSNELKQRIDDTSLALLNTIDPGGKVTQAVARVEEARAHILFAIHESELETQREEERVRTEVPLRERTLEDDELFVEALQAVSRKFHVNARIGVQLRTGGDEGTSGASKRQTTGKPFPKRLQLAEYKNPITIRTHEEYVRNFERSLEAEDPRTFPTVKSRLHTLKDISFVKTVKINICASDQAVRQYFTGQRLDLNYLEQVQQFKISVLLQKEQVARTDVAAAMHMRFSTERVNKYEKKHEKALKTLLAYTEVYKKIRELEKIALESRGAQGKEIVAVIFGLVAAGAVWYGLSQFELASISDIGRAMSRDDEIAPDPTNEETYFAALQAGIVGLGNYTVGTVTTVLSGLAQVFANQFPDSWGIAARILTDRATLGYSTFFAVFSIWLKRGVRGFPDMSATALSALNFPVILLIVYTGLVALIDVAILPATAGILAFWIMSAGLIAIFHDNLSQQYSAAETVASWIRIVMELLVKTVHFGALATSKMQNALNSFLPSSQKVIQMTASVISVAASQIPVVGALAKPAISKVSDELVKASRKPFIADPESSFGQTMIVSDPTLRQKVTDRMRSGARYADAFRTQMFAFQNTSRGVKAQVDDLIRKKDRIVKMLAGDAHTIEEIHEWIISGMSDAAIVGNVTEQKYVQEIVTEKEKEEKEEEMTQKVIKRVGPTQRIPRIKGKEKRRRQFVSLHKKSNASLRSLSGKDLKL